MGKNINELMFPSFYKVKIRPIVTENDNEKAFGAWVINQLTAVLVSGEYLFHDSGETRFATAGVTFDGNDPEVKGIVSAYIDDPKTLSLNNVRRIVNTEFDGINAFRLLIFTNHRVVISITMENEQDIRDIITWQQEVIASHVPTMQERIAQGYKEFDIPISGEERKLLMMFNYPYNHVLLEDIIPKSIYDKVQSIRINCDKCSIHVKMSPQT